ncbi:MAG: CBS domain-containing protein [Deltaproteobacteria bacterium]|nr:CBS domain-containing protein [Deltaproteobacteria bacterium]
MEKVIVKDMMVPLTGFVTVSEDDSFFDAVQALKKAVDVHGGIKSQRRAILVSDKDGKVVGKVSQLDIIRALEPKYDQMDSSRSMSRFGFNAKFISTMFEQFNLWNKPLDEICRKASRIKIKQFMYTLTEGEYVDQDDSLNKAVHKLVIGSHQSLLVTKEKEIVGILRLKDLFEEVCDRLDACEL